MNRVLVAALVTLGAAQAVAWGRLGLVDRENARLRTSLESAERRAANFARRPAARPAVATRIERPLVAAPLESLRPIESESIEVRTEAQGKDSTLEDLLALDANQRAWLETLRRQWAEIAGPYWIQSRTLEPDELEYLKSAARRFDEAFKASLGDEQLRALKRLGFPPLLWSVDGC